MITIYTIFWGAISSTQISNFLLIFNKGELYGIFVLWEPFRGRLLSVFELIKKIFFENMFFLPNVTTPTCFFSNSTKMKNHSSLLYSTKLLNINVTGDKTRGLENLQKGYPIFFSTLSRIQKFQKKLTGTCKKLLRSTTLVRGTLICIF